MSRPLQDWVECPFCDERVHSALGIIHPGLRKALRLAERWAIFWWLRFSVPKCESICFRASNVRIEREFSARMYGDEITHVPVLRYLGVWFDRSLTWGHQVTVGDGQG